MISPISPALLAKTFGVNALQTDIYKGKIRSENPDVSPIKRISSLGTSIFSDLKFADAYKKTSTGTQLITHKFPIDTVLIDVSQSKNIIKTQISGRDGTIKEYLGMGDYQISIKGIIAGARGVYPVEAVDNLLEFLTLNFSVGIISTYLNERYNIDEIVIIDYDVKQSEGEYNMAKFEITAISDYPVEVLIQQQKSSSGGGNGQMRSLF